MASTELQAVAGLVLRQAQKQGYVVPRDIRGELSQAGQDESRWKEVVELLRESLHYRQGRYYFIASAGSPRLREEQQHLEEVRETLSEVLKQHQSANDRPDRRQKERVPYTRPVKVQTEDNQELMVLTQDLSDSGIRFIANRSLLGRKIHVHLPPATSAAAPVQLVVRILWTTAVAEGLYENGGTFLEIINGPESGPAPPASP